MRRVSLFRARALLASLVVLAAGSTSAAASPTNDIYRLAWTRGSGADACPSESELAALVQARLGREAFDRSAPRAIEGNATQAQGSWHAELVVRDARGIALGRRELSTVGEDCHALTAAVTLAIVLTIDPNAPLSEAESATASFPEPPGAIAAPPSPEHTLPPPRPPEPTPAPPPRAPCPTRAPHEPGPAVSAFAVGSAGLLPRASLGFALEAAVPLASVAVHVGLRALPAVDSSDGHQSLGLTSGSVGLCWGGTLGAAVATWCGQVEGGVISAAARDLTPVSPGNYPWFALSTGPHLVWPARSRFGLELGLLASVPLTRQHFRVQSARNPEFQAAPLAGLVLVGVRAGAP